MAGNHKFVFSETADLTTNLDAFCAYVFSIHPRFAHALAGTLPNLRRDEYDINSVWDVLCDAVMELPEGGTEPSTAPTTGAAQSQSTTVTGWLLEGVEVQGFRGINNQDTPLQLKFHTDKINSISAVNGVGKSSIYDAIRFAIRGRLDWLESLPSSERVGDYYLNKFSNTGIATIVLHLAPEPAGPKCSVTVTRDAIGNRTVSCTGPFDANTVLRSIDREFVLLDGPTFQDFITKTPKDRGRAFSGLLGLAAYNDLRQELARLANTRSFNNHFDVDGIAKTLRASTTSANEARDNVRKDFLVLTGSELGPETPVEAQESCRMAMAQIALLAPHCADKSFQSIDIDACVAAIQAAEGGPKRERLAECIREINRLQSLIGSVPTTDQMAELRVRIRARDTALASTSGDLMLSLLEAASNLLAENDGITPTACPLCDNPVSNDLTAHVQEKLEKFEALTNAKQNLANAWSTPTWTQLKALEKIVEDDATKHLCHSLDDRAKAALLTTADVDALVDWQFEVSERANAKVAALVAEQVLIEQELPPSLVEVTKKAEAGRRLQDNWKKLEMAEGAWNAAKARETVVARLKELLDHASGVFASAEGEISRARLAGVEPVFRSYFDSMSFFNVVPTVVKPSNSEDLQLQLREFFGLPNLSPRALLSESFRNAFAVSLYLAAATLYGGLPKFIILDDVTSSFDAGHQFFLVELLRKTFARPANATGPQVILLSHDTMLEKLFNKHSNAGTWWHQRLEGTPQIAVHPQAGAVNKVRDQTISMLQAGQVTSAQEGVRQYLEYRLNDLISRLRIPVPIDVAFNDNKQLASEYLSAIEAAVKLHNAANSLVLDASQVTALNVSMATIVGNFLSHWGTGQTVTFTAASLLGVMQSIDAYCDCFTFIPPGGQKAFYKSLQQRQ